MITKLQPVVALLTLASLTWGIGCTTNPNESVRGRIDPVKKSDRIERFKLVEAEGRLFYHVTSPNEEWYVPVSQDEAGVPDIKLATSSAANLRAATDTAGGAEGPRQLFVLQNGKLFVHSMYFRLNPLDTDWGFPRPQFLYTVESVSNKGVRLFGVDRIVPWSMVSFSKTDEYDGSTRTPSQ